MLTVGIVDDNQLDLDKLELIVNHVPTVELLLKANSAEEVYTFIQENPVDLLITDIEMPGMSGYQLADFIHLNNMNTTIIFVTAKSGYAVHAFELNVHDYILKPYHQERLVQSIERFTTKKEAGKITGRLFIRSGGDLVIIPKDEIIFLERTGRTTTIYTKNEIFETYQSLGELEGDIREAMFIRSHRSFIINLQYVKRFAVYSKKSFTVIFEGTSEKALVTKEKLKYLQENYF
ncbi:response regulator transcription factor [Listeria grandensis]|uniref:Response regulator transcription factor n=1 Tax=Listeria grandensis TaxID=1494963 RepID=A0A7X0Y312_9LIST|nr:LytTR family DNA-binding domain-containing protein [Listeria grandensis]MBC1473877.1 response regulator transcription factor [Listeria grandensis]MBC1936106.1 response regulator transcription factor [Listeria grandensis]